MTAGVTYYDGDRFSSDVQLDDYIHGYQEVMRYMQVSGTARPLIAGYQDLDTDEPVETYETKIDFVPGYNIAAGLGARVRFADRVGLRLECAPALAYARVSSLTTLSEEWNGTGYDYYTYTVEYRKNEGDLPDEPPSTPTSELDYEHGGPRVSFSSIVARIGLVFSF
ncbi:MAG: hypothetical protein GF331_22860 [Chitinivibrionales bacterium]|nr:hypothetical protein [Chitinivibrionales bacterium]